MLIPLRKHSKKTKGTSTVAAHYAAKCPFCSKKNTFWGGDIKTIRIDGLNKCPHFSGVENKKVNFREDFDVLVDYNTNHIYINGVFIHKGTVGDLICYLEEFEYDETPECLYNVSTKLYYYRSEWGSNGRLELLIKYLKSNPVIKYIENYDI